MLLLLHRELKFQDEKVDEEKVQEENKEIVEAAQEISTKPQNAVKEEKAEDIPEEEEVITEDRGRNRARTRAEKAGCRT